MIEILTDATRLLAFANVLVLSTVVILAFSLLAYSFTYSFRVSVARRFSLVLACIMIVYASEVAVARVISPTAAEAWLRFEWLGIALMPAAYYLFSLGVLATTNYRVRRNWVGAIIGVISLLSAVDAIFGRQIVEDVRYTPLVAYLESGPLFWLFAGFFAVALVLSLRNILKARSRCLTDATRRRMNFLLLGFIAPGVGVFPYLIALSRLQGAPETSTFMFVLALVGNILVAVMIVVMSYTVAYFGALTPDRVVRYRMVRFLLRGPAVAILAILAIQTVPTIEEWLRLPRDIVLFSVITGVVVCSQLFLSVSKTLVDRLIYREDRDEIAWLRELDRHLLTTTDLRQFLENHLVALCELLRVQSGFVASVVGTDLILEVMVGSTEAYARVRSGADWADTLTRTVQNVDGPIPHSERGFWLWPLQERSEDGDVSVSMGMLGVEARTDAPLLSQDEEAVVESMVERITSALIDRRLQQSVFVTLRTIIPDIARIQSMRNMIPYVEHESETSTAAAMLDPSPIFSPEFEAWVKDALSHYWGGPKLTQSPLMGLRMVNDTLMRADDDPTKALRLVLASALERLKPEGKPNLTAPEWLLYNILEMRFIQGRKVREIADRLAMSESDLYRKQRVAIGHLARVLTEMEQENGATHAQDAFANDGYASGASANGASANGDSGTPAGTMPPSHSALTDGALEDDTFTDTFPGTFTEPSVETRAPNARTKPEEQDQKESQEPARQDTR